MEHNFFQLSKNNDVRFFKDGPDYRDEYLRLIRNAKSIIHLQTYIFKMDSFGKEVHHELINAAQRGVQVYLLIDRVGSRLFDNDAGVALKNAGVYFLKFNDIQLKWLYSWGRRLHHKILLVDDLFAFIGGINVSIELAPLNTQQLDFAVLLRGPAIKRLSEYCQVIFKKASPKKINFPPVVESPPVDNGIELKILVNDWVYRRWQITKQYSQITKSAKNDITIISSYFFPRKSFMKELVHASRRGVRVRLILPKLSDWPSYVKASEFLYDYFLKNGVEIYLWKKSVLHGKLATVDRNWITIGSFNLNYTSYQQNLEMNVNVYSGNFATLVHQEIEEIIISGCEKLDPEKFIEKCSFRIKALRLIDYLILSFIANCSIGLTYQENNRREHKFYNIVRIVSSLIFFVLGVFLIIFPIFPGIPFLIISILLIYKQFMTNKKKEAL